jgi:hypothetical protein
MANTTSFPLSIILVGDGVSLTAVVGVSPTPTSVSLVSAYSTTAGTDVSGNISSVVLTGSSVTFNFTAAFTGSISIEIALAYPLCSNIQLQPVAQVTSPWVVGGTFNAVPLTLVSGNNSPHQLDSTGAVFVNGSGNKATYRASINAFTPVTSGAFPCVTLQGSATKIIRITRVRYQVTSGTGSASYTFVVLQRFSAISGGTLIAVPSMTLDTNNAAATAVCDRYTVLPTVATANGGEIDCYSAAITTPTVSAATPLIQEFDFGGNGAQGLVLRGTSDFLGIRTQNLGATPSDNFMIEWTEE